MILPRSTRLALWAVFWVFVFPTVWGMATTRLGVDARDPMPDGWRGFLWTVSQPVWWIGKFGWDVLLWPGHVIAANFYPGMQRGDHPVLELAAGTFCVILVFGVGWTIVVGRDRFETAAFGWKWLGWFGRMRDWFQRSGRGPTSRWTGGGETLAKRWRKGDIFLGRRWSAFGGGDGAIGITTEKHMVTIAGTGAGKSTGALIPNLCLHDGPLLCIDPKGELARITAGRRQWMGQDTWVLDPFNVSGRGGGSYNPFDDIERLAARNEPGRVESFAARLAEALVKPMSKEPYWDEAPRTLLTGLILYVAGHEPPERRNLARVRELIAEGDVEGLKTWGDVAADDDERMTAFDALLMRMKRARKGLYGESIVRAAASIEMMGEDQFGGVVTSLQEHTKFLDNPLMQKVVRGGQGLALEDLIGGETSIYVCLPAHAVVGPEGRWLRMFVLLFINIVMGNDAMKAPNPPVLLAIDEFPNLGRLDGIELIAPMMRSYGVRFWAVGQDVSGFRNAYPNTWTSFISGAEAVQFMGVTDPPTVDLLVDLLGRHSFDRVEGQYRRREEYALMDRDQVSRFLAKDGGNQIVWFGSRRPMRLKICPYYEYLAPYYYDPDPRYPEGRWRRFQRWAGRRLA